MVSLGQLSDFFNPEFFRLEIHGYGEIICRSGFLYMIDCTFILLEERP